MEARERVLENILLVVVSWVEYKMKINYSDGVDMAVGWCAGEARNQRHIYIQTLTKMHLDHSWVSSLLSSMCSILGLR